MTGLDQRDARVRVLLNKARGFIHRAVIHHHDLEAVAVRRTQCVEGRRDRPLFVVRGNDHADRRQHRVGQRGPVPTTMADAPGYHQRQPQERQEREEQHHTDEPTRDARRESHRRDEGPTPPVLDAVADWHHTRGREPRRGADRLELISRLAQRADQHSETGDGLRSIATTVVEFDDGARAGLRHRTQREHGCAGTTPVRRVSIGQHRHVPVLRRNCERRVLAQPDVRTIGNEWRPEQGRTAPGGADDRELSHAEIPLQIRA